MVHIVLKAVLVWGKTAYNQLNNAVTSPPLNSYPNSPWICGFVHRRDLIKLQKSTNVNIFITQETILPGGICQAHWLTNPYNKGYQPQGLGEQQEAVVEGICE